MKERMAVETPGRSLTRGSPRPKIADKVQGTGRAPDPLESRPVPSRWFQTFLSSKFTRETLSISPQSPHSLSRLTQASPVAQDRTVVHQQGIPSVDLLKGARLVKDPWPKAFAPETIACIQTIQDSLASLSEMYIAVLDGTGAPLTIPSNQAARCSDCQGKHAEPPCLPNIKQAIADTSTNRVTTVSHCPFGLTTYFSPLGTLGNPSRGRMTAVLAIGRRPMANRSLQDGPLPEKGASLSLLGMEKTVTTFCRIFDLIFSLALHTMPSGPGPLASAAPAPNAVSLSAREQEVLHLVALGLSNRAIADRLFISETTVKSHVHNISRKVKINNRTSLALFFLQSM